MSKWINYGDVSFISEGGTMVRKSYSDEELKKYPSLNGTYDVLMLSPVADDTVCVGIKQIDVSDFNDKISYIESIFGDIPEDEAMFACYCAEYVGLEPGLDQAYKQIGMYSAAPDFYITKDEAKTWLTELGVAAEYLR